ncbi:hypothetical protein GGR40_000881 [Novosphingobium gossypii]
MAATLSFLGAVLMAQVAAPDSSSANGPLAARAATSGMR